MDDKYETTLNVSDLQMLYEGLTQEDDGFRNAMTELGYPVDKDELFNEKERAKNRLNYAMLGVHPIYRREVELAGLVDFHERTLSLASKPDDIVIPFNDMDPSYVSFLENQKRIYNTKSGKMPMSSVALKASNELNKDKMDVPDLNGVHLNVPQETTSTARQVLERAFTNSMVMMTHLNGMIKKHGFDEAYGMNKDHLLQHVASDQFNYNFTRSVEEIEQVASKSVDDYSL